MPLNITENWNFQLRVKYILFGFQTSTEYEYEYYSGLGNHANTNTNSIRFWKIIRIRIRIVFGLKISAEYEYEYHYSVSTIRILFEYRIIRSPLIQLLGHPALWDFFIRNSFELEKFWTGKNLNWNSFGHRNYDMKNYDMGIVTWKIMEHFWTFWTFEHFCIMCQLNKYLCIGYNMPNLGGWV